MAEGKSPADSPPASRAGGELDLERYRTQRFDADSESRYRAEMSRFYAPVLRVTVSMTIFIYIAYLVGDRLLFQRYANTDIDLLMLGIAAPASVLGIGATYTRLPDHLIRLAVFAATLVNGLCQVWSYDIGFHAGSPIPYEGMILVMCFAYFMLGMQYRWAMLLSLIVTGAHLLVSWRSRMPLAMLFDHATMMGSVVMIGATSGYLQDLFSRRSWSNERRLRELSERDALTGLYNRRHFDGTLMARIAEHRRHQRSFALLMIDIDHFKRINDDHGHDAGDRVLQMLADRLRQIARADEAAFRLGGEEFAVLIADPQGEQSLACAERIRTTAEAMPVIHGGQRLPPVTLSIGVACYPGDADSAGALLQKADAALYVAKRSGRNRVCHAGPLPAAKGTPASGKVAEYLGNRLDL